MNGTGIHELRKVNENYGNTIHKNMINKLANIQSNKELYDETNLPEMVL